MGDNSISMYSQERIVCYLYSLTGPQSNLPKILSELLGNDREVILKKLKNDLAFTPQDLVKIQTNFNNSVLELGMIA